MQQVKIVISEDGSIKVDAEGFKDNKCINDLEKLLSALKSTGIDVKITEQKKKPEYYAQQRTRVSITH